MSGYIDRRALNMTTVARVSAHDLSPPRHALPVTAGCEARGKAQGSLPIKATTGEGKAGRVKNMNPR